MTDIFYALTDQSRYVYHYTKASTLVDYILQSGKLLLSQFSRVNDPRENKPWTFSYRYSDAADLDIQALEARLNNYLKHHCRLCCFMVDPYEALATRKKELAGEDVVAGPLYERGHSQSPMWAHYGENYRGACLIFDRAKLNEELVKLAQAKGCRVFADLVEYRNPRVVHKLYEQHALLIDVDELRRVGDQAYAESHLLRHWQKLFFLKATAWSHEREYRWLLTGETSGDLYVGVEHSLVGVVLGEQFPAGYLPKVGVYAKEHNIQVAHMSWQNGVAQPSPTHWRILIGAA
jgi:hypothetical protein